MVWWYAVRFSLCYSSEPAQTCFLLNTEITSSFPLGIHKYSSLVLLLISSKASDWFTETSLSHTAGHNNQMSVATAEPCHAVRLPEFTVVKPCLITRLLLGACEIYIERERERERAPLPETRVVGGLTVCGLRWVVASVSDQIHQGGGINRNVFRLHRFIASHFRPFSVFPPSVSH